MFQNEEGFLVVDGEPLYLILDRRRREVRKEPDDKVFEYRKIIQQVRHPESSIDCGV